MRYMMLIHHDEEALAKAPKQQLWAEYAAFNEALAKAGAGFAGLDPEVNFWGISFPETGSGRPIEESVDALPECSRCQVRELAKMTVEEYRLALIPHTMPPLRPRGITTRPRTRPQGMRCRYLPGDIGPREHDRIVNSRVAADCA